MHAAQIIKIKQIILLQYTNVNEAVETVFNNNKKEMKELKWHIYKPI